MVTVEANEYLFDSWRGLGERVKALSAIVQNDMEIDDLELVEFQVKALELQRAIERLALATIAHIKDKEDF